MENTLITIGMYVTYALFVVALIVLVGFSVKQFAQNIRNNKATLYALIAFIVIFGISYVIASPTNVSELIFEKTGANYGSSRLIGSGLISFYILFGITVLTLLGAELSRPFKK
ncbi:MAG: hypothetical protein RRX93_04665 [Bacteroidales bacterium]